MMDAGFTLDQALLAAEVMEQEIEPVRIVDEQAERKRAADRERMRAKRSAMSRDVGDGCDNPDLSSPEGSFPKPLSPKPLQSIPPSPPKGGSSPVEVEFAEVFWPAYPHKVGKPDAKAKFVKARAKADLETIMAGLQRYVAKTDDRHWCNPATWLFQQRWEDQPAQMARGSPHTPKAPSQAEVFAFIARNSSDDPGPEYDDSGSTRQAISHLR
jgi:hypothetical protein